MKSPVSADSQVVDPAGKFKKRLAGLQKRIKKIEDPEGYIQEIIAEKRDKFLNTALARFERRQAQVGEKKAVVSKKREQKSVINTEETTKGSEVVEEPLRQMVVEEEEKVEVAHTVPMSVNSKPITKTMAPTSLLRKPGTGPQPPVPSLLSGSRLLR